MGFIECKWGAYQTVEIGPARQSSRNRRMLTTVLRLGGTELLVLLTTSDGDASQRLTFCSKPF